MGKWKLFKKTKRLRFLVMYPLAVLILYKACPTRESLSLGSWFVLCGVLIRLWANGYAVKLGKLTISGPYSIIRHPLYLGTAFVAVGVAAILRASYFVFFFLTVMAIVYYITIAREERMLIDKYKDGYLNYKKSVPALIPYRAPYTKGEKWSFSAKRLFRDNREYKMVFWTAVLLVFFYIKSKLVVEHSPMDSQAWFLVGAAFSLAVFDGVIDFVNWVKRNKLILNI